MIRNQNQHYLGRHHDWLDGSHRPALFRTPYRDVAVNELFEVNVKDFALRGEIIACEADDKGYPAVEVLNPIPDAAAGDGRTAGHRRAAGRGLLKLPAPHPI